MKSSLLVFGGFADDSQSILAAIYRFALVLRKLLTKAFLRLGCYFEGIERRIEGSGAVFADTNGGRSSDPFNYPQIAFFHASVSHRLERSASARPVDFKWHHYPII